jgi:hypothetical protein
VSKLLHAGWIAAVVTGALAVSAAPAATPTLPTLKLAAPRTIKVNHPYRVTASGQTEPGQTDHLWIFIRTSGKCKKTPTAEAMDGSYSAFGHTITRVGPGKYSKKTPKTIFEKPHKNAKICGYLYGNDKTVRVVRKIESVAD